MAKPFPDDVVEAAWARSGGRCECGRTSHGHGQRCKKELYKSSRGLESLMGWEPHHINSNGEPVLSNCEILCQDCHKATRSYGR